MVLFKGVPAEYGVEGIAEARPQPHYKAFYCYAATVPSKARYQYATCKGHGQGYKFDSCNPLMEQKQRKEYDKNWGSVEQDYSYRCTRFYYGLKVAQGKESQAYDPCAYEHPNVFQPKVKQLFVGEKKIQGKDSRCYYSPELQYLDGGNTACIHPFYENAYYAPKDSCCYD